MRALIPIFLAGALSAVASEPAWLTDLAAAKQAAAKEQRPLLLHFTGSAWCPPCKLLHAEALATPAFAEVAKKYVLVKLDYPPLSERAEAKVKANPALAKLMEIKQQYAVPGFPTTILLSPSGTETGRRVGYEKGLGLAAYMAQLEKGGNSGALR
ncbi:MAG: thioredoxin family protein [Acidobacteria bacterium]|nr:thioredoxin family protein [Acidobacteriota bacterium]